MSARPFWPEDIWRGTDPFVNLDTGSLYQCRFILRSTFLAGDVCAFVFVTGFCKLVFLSLGGLITQL